jgi:hypothetical protein
VERTVVVVVSVGESARGIKTIVISENKKRRRFRTHIAFDDWRLKTVELSPVVFTRRKEGNGKMVMSMFKVAQIP